MHNYVYKKIPSLEHQNCAKVFYMIWTKILDALHWNFSNITVFYCYHWFKSKGTA